MPRKHPLTNVGANSHSKKSRASKSRRPVDIIEYRNYALTVTQDLLQWRVVIFSTKSDVPEMPLEKQIVRGWEREEVLARAKIRVDDRLEFRFVS